MKKPISRYSKIVVLMLLVTCLLTTSVPALATEIYTGNLDCTFQSLITFPILAKALENPEVQTSFVISIETFLKESRAGLLLNEESPVYLRLDEENEEINIYFSNLFRGNYVLLNITNKSSSYLVNNKYKYDEHGEEYETDTNVFVSFLSVADPYETPEQMTAYLDAQDYTYYTVSPEALTEAQASLEAN